MDDKLISISPPERQLDRELLHTPGGFMWWYLDMVNPQGQGAVVIWSWGLPFLPGLAEASRRGAPQVPYWRPSLNVAIYDDWELDCYLLQEYAPDQAEWHAEDGRWVFGDSTLRVRREDGAVSVHASLDCAVPGSSERLTGTIDLEGVARHARGGGDDDVDPNHDWTPLMGPATGTLDVRGPNQRQYTFEGRAYHDRNGGRAPLHALGFSHWIWGRLPFEGHERIYYILWPQGGGAPAAVGMRIEADGETELLDDIDVRLTKPRTELAGMKWHERIELFHAGRPWMTVEPRAILDNGPFYLRFFTEARAEDEAGRAVGVGEACRPDRIDLAVHRPLVKMRVQRPDERDNSMWLPLFTGPKRGRITRLLKHAVAGARR